MVKRFCHTFMAGESLSSLLIGLSVLLCLVIVVMVFPLPFSLKKQVIGYMSKATLGFYGMLALLFVMFLQEFNEQRKFDERRRKATDSGEGTNLHYFAFEYFRHQRQMYLVLVALVINVIATVILRALKVFVKEHEQLQEEVRQAEEAARRAAAAEGREAE